ncbi:MAG TPA: dihydrolipoyl dehydrogenase [Acidimicrobiales bacterium]|nr:dihydrolipoyl dehydrogenase [Acidimicrobiales bacterium]
MSEHFDVVVIGGGPAGYAAALYGASAGLNIAVVEKEKVGGTCLHRGCIPAKEYLETATVYRTVSHAKDFGIVSDQPTVEFATSQQRKQKVVDQLWKGLQGLMKQRKITTFLGTGRLDADGVVRVVDGDAAGTELHGDSVLLASGSVPRTLPGFDIDGKYVLTSDEVLMLDTLPSSAVVVGGGAIGCEFASSMSDLGVQVTVLEFLPQILTGVDKDAADVVARSFKKRGIDVRTGVEVKGHQPTADGKQTTVTFGEGETVTADIVVMSVGRRPLSDGLLGEGSPVAVDERGFVKVDPWMRTNVANVYALGDLIAVDGVRVHPQLAHVGFAEGMLAIKVILGEPAMPVDYSKVPMCIYTYPEVAYAGLTEQAARDAGYDVAVSKHRYVGNGRALIIGDADGLVKVIAAKDASGKAGTILGVHMVGPWVTEQLGQAYLSVNWEATVDEVSAFIQPHPSLSELFGETVIALTGRGLHG